MINAKEAYIEVLEFRRKEREELRQLVTLEIELINNCIRNSAKKGNTQVIHQFTKNDDNLVDKVLRKLHLNGFGTECEIINSLNYVSISWDDREED